MMTDLSDTNYLVDDVQNIKDPLLNLENFPFESDSFALKGNEDYLKLLECLAILEGARIQTIKDIETLLDLQEEALKDPSTFVDKLIKGEDLGFPQKLSLPNVPTIDWEKYKITVPLDSRPITRPKKLENKLEDARGDNNTLRSRVKTTATPKSETYNQLWTVEEQLKLEMLLAKYPQEENEARRFAKIAKELGNRTPSQVTSRCQKYFLKLLKAGLPVPGRISRGAYQRASGKSGGRSRRPLSTQSTFFPHTMTPSIGKSDPGEDLPGTSHVSLVKIKEELIDPGAEDDVPQEVRESDEYRKLALLRRVKKDIEIYGDCAAIPHFGYKCDYCNVEPILGTRWHCEDCGDDEHSVDLCSTCVIQQVESARPHPLSHNFVPCRLQSNANGSWDKDYSYENYLASGGNYNYLDPNFLPE